MWLLCSVCCCLAAASSPAASIRGALDGFVSPASPTNKCEPNCQLTGFQVAGWAVDPSLAGGGVAPIMVEIQIDDATVASVLANQPRPDLVPAKVAPNPNHGFRVSLPASAVAKLKSKGAHSLKAVAKRTVLPSSPSCGQVSCGSGPGPDRFEYIENGQIRVGIDQNRGGSIGFIAASNTPESNVVNCHDMGREIQLSFYGGPGVYNPPTTKFPKGACDHLFGPSWPWNPIGAGDVDGNHGEVLSFSKNKTGWHILTRPLQWACHNVSCDCTFEQSGTLVGNGIRLISTLHNRRTDTTDYPARSQELPAVYTNGPYYRLLSYNGSKPFTNDSVAEYNTGFRGPGAKGGAWIPGVFRPTEHWAAFIDKDGFGLGVVNTETPTFLAGFSGAKGSGGPHDPSTGYIAPTMGVKLGPNEDYTFTSYLVLGNLVDIRAYATNVAREAGLVRTSGESESGRTTEQEVHASAGAGEMPTLKFNHMQHAELSHATT